MDFDEYDYLDRTAENPDTKTGTHQVDKSGDQDQSKGPKHRSEGNDNVDHRSKRSRTGDESHGDEKERSSSFRHCSSLRDRERSERERRRSNQESKDGYKDRSRAEGSKKERDRDKIKERDRERNMDKDSKRREHGREDEKQRGREREQEKSNRRSHSGRHLGDGEREGSRDREKDRDMEHEGRERESQLREQYQESRRFKEKKEEVAEPEADPERDQRTVFAYQVSLKADERDVYEFFSRAGKVRDVRLIMDRISRRSKGVGYVEFYDAMSVPMAIALSGQPLLGQPVMVKPSEAEKNLVQSTVSVAAGDTGFIGPYSGGGRRLYVGNLHSNIKEDQLRQVFEPFGTVELVRLPFDLETGRGKGYGFVQFSRLEDARAALNLDGQLDIAGQVMEVSAVTDQTRGQEASANAGDLDDDKGSGLPLNAQSRILLMQKLDRTGTTSSGAVSLGSQVVNDPGLSTTAASVLGAAPGVSPIVIPFGQIPVPALAGFPTAGLSLPAVTVPTINTIGIPSECLLLKNMFDPKLESEPEFDQDIKDDVEDECSKFGQLKHIYVDKKSDGGVYLRFENSQSAIAAQRALHGRWFAGKMITATFMVLQDYEDKFPESK